MFRLALMIVFSALAARAFWRLVGGVIDGFTDRAPRGTVAQRGVKMVRDPVCGTYVLPDSALALGDGARRVFFCSSRCRDQYRATSVEGRTA